LDGEEDASPSFASIAAIKSFSPPPVNSRNPKAFPSSTAGRNNLGQWEKHTKGIGSKLLQKMGWTPGTGLGTSEAGIVKPVEVKVRPKGMGLAYREFDESTSTTVHRKSSKRMPGEESTVQQTKKAVYKRDGWRKDGDTMRRKVAYKTVDEIIAESAGLVAGEDDQRSQLSSSRTISSTIIKDMRGPAEQEIDLGSGTGVSSVVGEYEPSPYLQELRFNVRLLAERSNVFLQDLGKSLTISRYKISDLDRQCKIVQQRLNLAPAAIKRMERVLGVMRQLGERARSSVSTSTSEGLNSVEHHYQDLFDQLLGDCYQEFVEYSLSTAVVALLAPAVRFLIFVFKIVIIFDNLHGSD
jgi:tuftelin-interacting protein 11